MKIKFSIFLFYSILSFSLIAQKVNPDDVLLTPTEIWEAGLPYIESYTSDDYKNSPWNFRIIEGNNGFMYIGNGEGVLEFDGNSWNFISTESKKWIMALAKTDTKKIFVGGDEELGYLEPDELGKMRFQSLMHFLEPVYRDFGTITSIVIEGNNVYFSSYKYLFRWDGKKFKAWQAKEEFSEIFKVNGSLYINDTSEGLQELVGDTLHFIPGSEVLLKDEDGKQLARIREMLPYQNNQILIIHSHQGVLLYNGKSFEPFNQKSNDILIKSNVYRGVALSNGDYALATLAFGLYIIDGKTGEIKKRLGKKHGLASNELYAVYEDSNQAIWVCGGKGISKVEWASPFRILNELSGLNEIVTSICYQSGKFLVDSNGLYQLTKSDLYKENKELIFKKIEGVRGGRIRDIISTKNEILVFNVSHIHKISDNYTAELIKEESSSFTSVIKSNVDDSKFYIGTSKQKLFDFTLIDNQWIARPILEIDGIITGIMEEPEGNLWFSVYEKGLYFGEKLSDNSDEQTKFVIKKYDTLSGLPSMSNNYMAQFKNELVASTEDGYYKFNKIDQTFEKYSLWPNQYDESIENLGHEILDNKGDLWHTAIVDDENKIFKLSENKLSEVTEYKLFSDSRLESFELMNDIVLFVTTNGILMYKQDGARSFNRNLSTKLRKVWVNNDSLVYAGSNHHKNKEDSFEISFKNNTLKFEYTLPFYTKSQKNEYQYFLEGFEDDWSSWSTETKKDYTNIPPGGYIFKVRSKNIYDEIGGVDNYSFTILPPWYQTWWMYLVYALGTILGIVFIAEWRSNQLRKKNNALEAIIKERTSEIVQKNHQLEDQTEQLKVVDKMKTRLFANISHEFRTPLTLIKGPIEQLEQHPEKKLSTSSVKMIRRNANRLLNLVNQLLDLSKLESGNLELEASEGSVYKCLRAAASSFSSHAAQRNIDYQIRIPSNKILWASFDRDKLEKIVYNLLSNAFKFTDDDTAVSISVKFSKEQLTIEVVDSGCGIPSDTLPFIFDRFFQVDDSFTKEKEGTGIGLSLTKELVELMNGAIYVESEYKKGSIFKVTLPLEEIKTFKKEDKEKFKREVFIKDEVVSTKSKNNDLHTILVVEDNEDMRDFIKQQLEKQYQIIEAYNGQDGLKKALKIMPDLIITDLMMPKIDGISLSKQLKKEINTSHIPIIMLTAKAGIENKIEGLETGADDYLTKPFNVKELDVRVKNLIKQRQKLRELFSKKDIINPKEVTLTSIDEQFLQKIIDLLEKQFSNSNFDISQMREELAMSNAQLHRKIKALTNQSPGELLRNFRLKRATQILKQNGAHVTEVAYDVGFNNLSYFAKCFKEFHGVSPSVFIKNHKNS